MWAGIALMAAQMLMSMLSKKGGQAGPMDMGQPTGANLGKIAQPTQPMGVGMGNTVPSGANVGSSSPNTVGMSPWLQQAYSNMNNSMWG